MHYGGHLRGPFCNWVEEGMADLATLEVGYEERRVPAEEFLATMSECSDIMPGWLCTELEEIGVELPLRTYGAAAESLLADRQ